MPYRSSGIKEVLKIDAERARRELANIEAVLSLQAFGDEPETLIRSGWRWLRVGDTRCLLGSSILASFAYQKGHEQFSAAAERKHADHELRYNLSVSWHRLGNVRRAQGDLSGALRLYEQAHTVLNQLTLLDKENIHLGPVDERHRS